MRDAGAPSGAAASHQPLSGWYVRAEIDHRTIIKNALVEYLATRGCEELGLDADREGPSGNITPPAILLGKVLAQNLPGYAKKLKIDPGAILDKLESEGSLDGNVIISLETFLWYAFKTKVGTALPRRVPREDSRAWLGRLLEVAMDDIFKIQIPIIQDLQEIVVLETRLKTLKDGMDDNKELGRQSWHHFRRGS